MTFDAFLALSELSWILFTPPITIKSGGTLKWRIMIRLPVNDGYYCGSNLQNFFLIFLGCTGYSSRRISKRNSMPVKEKSKLVYYSKNILISFKSYPVKKGKLKTLSLLGSNIERLLHVPTLFLFISISRMVRVFGWQTWVSLYYSLIIIFSKHSTMASSPSESWCTNWEIII